MEQARVPSHAPETNKTKTHFKNSGPRGKTKWQLELLAHRDYIEHIASGQDFYWRIAVCLNWPVVILFLHVSLANEKFFLLKLKKEVCKQKIGTQSFTFYSIWAVSLIWNRIFAWVQYQVYLLHHKEPSFLSFSGWSTLFGSKKVSVSYLEETLFWILAHGGFDLDTPNLNSVTLGTLTTRFA